MKHLMRKMLLVAGFMLAAGMACAQTTLEVAAEHRLQIDFRNSGQRGGQAYQRCHGQDRTEPAEGL